MSAVIGWAATSSALTTTFSTGFEGWTQTSGVTHQVAGGNLGGHLQFADSGPANGGQIVAPNTYLGNWLTSYGANGTFSLDYRVVRAGVFMPFPMGVTITGTSGSMSHSFPGNFTAAFGWTNWSSALNANTWSVSGNLNSILGNVTEVRVFMPCSSDALEITGVDNISVAAVPEPASALAFAGFALVLLKGGRRRR
ncbi:MAG: hypothetical protein JNJ45_02610 [Chthonomonas sp.]|nr:hypothetical protein [Chthonomonas sp.]